MSYIEPCPQCGSEHLAVYKYDSGWRFVECDGAGCTYSGPGEGSIKEAIKSHNAAVTRPERPGFFESLTPEQQKAALEYDGPENHGDPALTRPESETP